MKRITKKITAPIQCKKTYTIINVKVNTIIKSRICTILVNFPFLTLGLRVPDLTKLVSQSPFHE